VKCLSQERGTPSPRSQRARHSAATKFIKQFPETSPRRRPPRRFALFALACALTAAGAMAGGRARAQELRLIRLSAEGLPASDVGSPSSGGDLGAWAGLSVTPDGRWVVYRHDDRVDEVYELYVASRDGATRIRLSPDLQSGESIREVVLAPDGASVISLRGFAATRSWALYRVPIGGPSDAEELLYEESDPGRTIANYPLEVSADSRWFVFRTSPRSQEGSDAILVARLDATPAKVHPVFPAPDWSGTVRGASISPDSARFVLLSEHLFGVPLEGGPADLVRLDEGDAAGVGTPARVRITPDSRHVVFVESRATPTPSELYSVPIAGPGSAAVRLSPPTSDSGTVVNSVVTNDSQVVTFSLLPAHLAPMQSWSVPVSGPASEAVRLDAGAMGWMGSGTPIPTPDSTQAVLSLDPAGAGERRLVKVPIRGPAEAAVAVTPLYGPHAKFFSQNFSPDGRQVVYVVERDVPEPRKQAYTVPLEGPPELARAIGGPFTDEPQLAWWLIDPGSRSVALIGDYAEPLRYEILRARFDRPDLPAEPVHPELPPGGSARNELLWTSDGYGLLFRADLETAGKVDLFIADALVFADGLESGDLQRWSLIAAQPEAEAAPN
jgi:hypothetical protein